MLFLDFTDLIQLLKMNKWFLVVFFITTHFVNAQNSSISSSESTATNQDVIRAQPINGINHFRNFVIDEILKSFVHSQKKSIQAKIVIRFSVNEQGELVDFEVLENQSKSKLKIAEKAVLAMKKYPKWNPSYRDGKPTKMSCSFPINLNITME